MGGAQQLLKGLLSLLTESLKFWERTINGWVMVGGEDECGAANMYFVLWCQGGKLNFIVENNKLEVWTPEALGEG